MSTYRFSNEVESQLRRELSIADKPLRVSLTGHGQTSRRGVGHYWPNFRVMTFDSSTIVGVLFDAEEFGRSYRVGKRVMLDFPIESIEFLRSKVLEENSGRRKPMERIRKSWNRVWNTKRNPPDDEELEGLRKRVAELERENAYFKGINVDVAPFGFLGTELPPCPPNAITTCRIGPDLFAIYIKEFDDEDFLRIDLIEANYFGHDKEPAYTDLQTRMRKCFLEGRIIIRWLDFLVTPKAMRETNWDNPYASYWTVLETINVRDEKF